MDRRPVLFATLAAATGIGLVLLSNREQIGPLVGETGEEGRARLAKNLEETGQRIEETKKRLGETAHRAQATAVRQTGSAWERAKAAAIGTALGAVWTGLLAGFVLFVYAPDRYQREKLWQATKPVLDTMRGMLVELWRLGGELRQSRTQDVEREARAA